MSRERAYCECDAQDGQGCAHAPDPCFQEAQTVLPDGEGIPTNVCLSCAVAQGERVALPCHSIHCRHYDLARGVVCKVQIERLRAQLEAL